MTLGREFLRPRPFQPAVVDKGMPPEQLYMSGLDAQDVGGNSNPVVWEELQTGVSNILGTGLQRPLSPPLGLLSYGRPLLNSTRSPFREEDVDSGAAWKGEAIAERTGDKFIKEVIATVIIANVGVANCGLRNSRSSAVKSLGRGETEVGSNAIGCAFTRAKSPNPL